MAQKNKVRKDTTGTTLFDFLEKLLPQKIILVIVIIALFLFSGLNIYAFFEGRKGRQVNTLFFSIGEDPFLQERVAATCSAICPVCINPQNSITQDIVNPTFIPNQTPTQDNYQINSIYFHDKCIPAYTDNRLTTPVWNLFPLSTINQSDQCLNVGLGSGFISHENELEILVSNQSITSYQAITIDIPNNANSISFSVDISKLKVVNPNLACKFFYGFADKVTSKELSGKFVFYTDTINISPISYYVGENPSKPIMGLKYATNNEQKILIDVSKPGYMTIKINESSPIALKNLPINSKKFVIGYYIPATGTIEMAISDLSIE